MQIFIASASAGPLQRGGNTAYDSDVFDKRQQNQRRYKYRWKDERFFDWLHKFRRLPIRHEHLADHLPGMSLLGSVITLLR